jgi:hypothetical protein
MGLLPLPSGRGEGPEGVAPAPWPAGVEPRPRAFLSRSPDSCADGAPTDHFGRLQSEDAQPHALVLTPTEHAELLASGSAMAAAVQRDSHWLWHR